MGIDRRNFIKTSSLLPIAAGWTPSREATGQTSSADRAPPEIVDTNVHLFEWPFRKLKYQRTQDLIAKLRRHRITQAWVGNFEAVLHKQLDAMNRALMEECRARGDGMLLPVGTVNPAWPDWEEDLRRLHEGYGMHGVRLYPAYHGYTPAHEAVPQLLDAAARRNLIVQIVLRLEDERIHHVATQVPRIQVKPLIDVLKRIPSAKVQLLNAAGPLLGLDAADLVRETKVVFDIAAIEGNGGIGRLIAGENYSYRCAIPADRLLFGSHAPYFPCESAVMKLFESPLNREQLIQIMRENARRFIDL